MELMSPTCPVAAKIGCAIVEMESLDLVVGDDLDEESIPSKRAGVTTCVREDESEGAHMKSVGLFSNPGGRPVCSPSASEVVENNSDKDADESAVSSSWCRRLNSFPSGEEGMNPYCVEVWKVCLMSFVGIDAKNGFMDSATKLRSWT